MTLQDILSPVRKAINDYKMIERGDRIAVGVSGGKDSLTLLAALKGYQRFSPEAFELEAINIDLGFRDTDRTVSENLRTHIEDMGVRYTSVKTDIGEIIFDTRKEKNPCSLCSKMRRGALNAKAKELGCNKLALGHHSDDLMETFFLSLLFEGRLSTFQPVSYMSRTNITLIRPLLYLKEKDIVSFTREMPILKNPCPADKHTQREAMKTLIDELQKQIPCAKERIFSAITSPERQNLFPPKQDNTQTPPK